MGLATQRMSGEAHVGASTRACWRALPRASLLLDPASVLTLPRPALPARHGAQRREAGGLAPLVQLLGVGLQLAGGERRTAVAALQALQPLVGEPGCQEQLAGPCST